MMSRPLRERRDRAVRTITLQTRSDPVDREAPRFASRAACPIRRTVPAEFQLHQVGPPSASQVKCTRGKQPR